MATRFGELGSAHVSVELSSQRQHRAASDPEPFRGRRGAMEWRSAGLRAKLEATTATFQRWRTGLRITGAPTGTGATGATERSAVRWIACKIDIVNPRLLFEIEPHG